MEIFQRAFSADLLAGEVPTSEEIYEVVSIKYFSDK
jgi:hypothetical protein